MEWGMLLMWKRKSGWWLVSVLSLSLWISLTGVQSAVAEPGGPGSHSADGETSSQEERVQVAKSLISGANLNPDQKSDISLRLRESMTAPEFKKMLDEVPNLPKSAKTLLARSFQEMTDPDGRISRET